MTPDDGARRERMTAAEEAEMLPPFPEQRRRRRFSLMLILLIVFGAIVSFGVLNRVSTGPTCGKLCTPADYDAAIGAIEGQLGGHQAGWIHLFPGMIQVADGRGKVVQWRDGNLTPLNDAATPSGQPFDLDRTRGLDPKAAFQTLSQRAGTLVRVIVIEQPSGRVEPLATYTDQAKRPRAATVPALVDTTP